jgi:hypothetical protein
MRRGLEQDEAAPRPAAGDELRNLEGGSCGGLTLFSCAPADRDTLERATAALEAGAADAGCIVWRGCIGGRNPVAPWRVATASRTASAPREIAETM